MERHKRQKFTVTDSKVNLAVQRAALNLLNNKPVSTAVIREKQRGGERQYRNREKESARIKSALNCCVSETSIHEGMYAHTYVRKHADMYITCMYTHADTYVPNLESLEASSACACM